MSLRLTSDDLRHLAAATEALLAPPERAGAEAWWRAAEERLCALFDGAQAMLTAGRAGARMADVLSQSLDTRGVRALGGFLSTDPRTGRIGNVDPAIAAWQRHRRAAGRELWHEAATVAELAALGHDARRSAFYDTLLSATRLHDSFGLVTEAGGGELFLTIGYERRGRGRFGGGDAAVAALLLPAFRAGHRALATLGESRAALAATLDEGTLALLVMGPDGRELHRTAALRRALAAEPERARVEAAARALADGMRALVGRTAALPARPEAVVATPMARHRLRATLAPAALWGVHGAVQVCVESAPSPVAGPAAGAAAARGVDGAATAGEPPAVGGVAAPIGLTGREAEVARLLARRATNAEVAAALGVSAHTARHHTERVMQKLGLRSRRAVAAALAGSGGPH